MKLPDRNPFRTGDIVEFIPGGESWVVAWCDGKRVICCGWPCSIADVSDCAMLEEGKDSDCEDILKSMSEIREHSDPRRIYAENFLRGEKNVRTR